MAYQIQALDQDGFQLTSGPQEFTKREAVKVAKAYLVDKELIAAGLYTVQIRDEHNQVLQDWFV